MLHLNKLLIGVISAVFVIACCVDAFAVASRKLTDQSHHEDPLMHHLVDSNYFELPGMKFHLPQFDPVVINGITFDFSITNHFVYFWIGIIVLAIILSFYKQKKLVQTSMPGKLVETLILFVRDEIVKPSIPHNYNKYLPFLLMLFSFILIENIIGLVPFTSQATKNISVTASLAVITFFVIQFSSFRKNGFFGYFKRMMPISAKDMNIIAVIFFNMILLPIEFLGQLTRPFALAIRLFANMVAGHAVILSFLLLGWSGQELGWNVFVSIPSLFGSVFIYLLEFLVAFLQAYVFTLLAAMFIGEVLESSH